MLASIFQAAGYKTGLYTSPYILRFNERMQVNGQQIPDKAICELTEYIKPMADSIFEQPTEFEMVTAPVSYTHLDDRGQECKADGQRVRLLG